MHPSPMELFIWEFLRSTPHVANAHHITPMMGYIVDSFFIDILELIFIFLFHLISAS